MRAFRHCLCLVASVATAHLHTAHPLDNTRWHRSSLLPNEVVTVKFSVHTAETNLSAVKELVQRVSDPTSAQYGQYLLQAELDALTAPLEEDVETVQEWLRPCQHVRESLGGRRFEVECTLSAAENLLRTSFHRLTERGDSGRSLVRAGDFELPEAVEGAVAALFGVHGLPAPRRRPRRSSPVDPGPLVTPDLIAARYNVSGVTVAKKSTNAQAVIEIQNCGINPKDIDAYFKKFLPTKNAPKVSKYVGDTPPGKDCGEAALDIQLMMGVSPAVATEFWFWKDNDFCQGIKAWTSAALSGDDVPAVQSLSYGDQGDVVKDFQCSEAAVKSMDNDFAKLAAKGISIIIASGDGGVSADPGTDDDANCFKDAVGTKDKTIVGHLKSSKKADSLQDCCINTQDDPFFQGWTWHAKTKNCSTWTTNTGLAVLKGTVASGKPPVAKLYPAWPASSPFVTAVGATYFVGHKAANAEMAVDSFGSGGGFSRDFGQNPDAKYQVTDVQNYLKNAPQLPPQTSFPASGRATPDVSALGDNIPIFDDGKQSATGGTSASAPLFAALVGLLNEARQQAGKPTMGLLNPFIYQNQATAFTDVVVGDNAVDSGGLRSMLGFNCTKGWDPVTGVGTPAFQGLLAAALGA